MRTKHQKPICYNTGKCFARQHGYCNILSKPMTKCPCPFRKEKKEYTNGKYYPLIRECGKE